MVDTVVIVAIVALALSVILSIVLIARHIADKGSGDHGGGGGDHGGGGGDHGKCTDNDSCGKGNCTPSNTKDGATLYIMPEANGFDISDIVPFKASNGCCYLIDPETVNKNFPGGVAVVANASGDIDAQYNHKYIKSLVDASCVPMIKWIVFYFGKDGKFCRCQNGVESDGKVACGDGDQPVCKTQCAGKTKDDRVPWDVNDCNICKYASSTEYPTCLQGSSNSTVFDLIYKTCSDIEDLQGIMFDDETGDPRYVVQLLEQIKDKWDSTHSNKLMLGWTGGLSAAKLPRPRNEESGKMTWDVLLGQAYTNTTGDYYASSCTPGPGWWDSVGKAMSGSPAGRGVPMVCGAGDCVGDVSAGGETKCYDERLSGATITDLINRRPSDFIWKNFGIWYGTTAAPCGFQSCYFDGDTSKAKTGCQTDGWTRLSPADWAKECSK